MPFSTALVDLAIGITVLEAAALLVYHRWTGRGLSARRIVPTIGAGLFLMAALRVATTDSASQWLVPALLGCAGIAHALDVAARWLEG